MVAVISALTGEGFEQLEERLGELLTGNAKTLDIILPASDGRKIAWLHAHGDVLLDEEAAEDSEKGPQRHITVRLNPKEMGQFATL